MAQFSDDSAGAMIFGSIVVTAILVLALIITPFLLIGIPAYVFYRLHKESPRRLERLAREETEFLYNHALNGQVRLSDAEIDAALSHHWPPDTPEPLKIQLLGIGKALLSAEGLSPEIPPMPALCNTVEGARYRDMLARSGQARSDRVMVLTALDVISDSLGTIAQAVPPIEGDVLVDVTQFVHPLGQAVQNVIAPFFADNDGFVAQIGLRSYFP
ncbi:hypothetical protein OAN307_c31640 [Octadecabacter antarcticus 307]|uniref:Uncharacterized protein n=1 Tax=Octadecabacter antarcticus 307 TaxID=391626 RepID=M9R906_9RHOB|nr:hypothetical protein [Octadecabacter antarcticus]AGI68697.1 hypothetical protein OAN307_c31640 [Octadecabacter antarcticus 307]